MSSKIVRLEAENVKRIRAVEITPKGDVVVIGGKNAQGKSSILDSIIYALRGKAEICEEPLRRGADHGHVVCETDELVIKRTFTASGNTHLTVSNKDGASYKSPQAIIDKLLGDNTLDPLEFMRRKPVEQVHTMLTLAGLHDKFASLEQERAETFGERTDVNRDLRTAKAKLEGMTLHEDLETGATVKSAGELAAKLKVMNDRTALIDNCKAEETRAKERMVEALAEVERKQKEIERLQLEIQNAQAEFKKAEAVQAQKADEISALEKQAEADESSEDIEAQLDELEQYNAKVRDNNAYAEQEKEIDRLKSQSDALTQNIEAIDKHKAEAIASAKFPVEGLGFNDSGITMHGMPFKQASSAERLRVSCAIGLAMNPKLKVLLIRDGSLLDDEGLQLVASMAADHDAQIWIERVGDGDECSVVIEDGAVSEPTNSEAQ